MRFVLYTEKTVAQCMSAITERLHTRSSRGQIDGWTDKGGKFSLALTAPVLRSLKRRTVLTARAERENGVTVIRGDVPSGAGPRERAVVYGALAIGALILIGAGQILLSVLILPAALLLYLPMKGDHDNHQTLVGDVQRTLKARSTPPKPAAGASAVRQTGTAARQTGTTARQTGSSKAAKPAARSTPAPKTTAKG